MNASGVKPEAFVFSGTFFVETLRGRFIRATRLRWAPNRGQRRRLGGEIREELVEICLVNEPARAATSRLQTNSPAIPRWATKQNPSRYGGGVNTFRTTSTRKLANDLRDGQIRIRISGHVVPRIG